MERFFRTVRDQFLVEIAGRKAYLFCFIDDHSRAVMGDRWAFHEDVVRLAAALRPALASRGVPESVYVDYADPRIMPILARKACPAGVRERTVSA